MTRESQDARVKTINRELVNMTSLVEKQIYESMICLKNFDLDKAEQIIKGDDKVDEMQKQLRKNALNLLQLSNLWRLI